MPELAEVAFYSMQWAAGKRRPLIEIYANEKSRVFRGCDVSAMLAGLQNCKLIDSRTHGKQMLFEFSGGHWLIVHLGMTGELSAEPQPYAPAKHDHLVLHTRKLAMIFNDPRQFGSILYRCEDNLPASWRALPPQIMDAAFTVKRLTDILKRHARTPLKALLLDQRYFPGIGNWMADEVMWQLRLHPLTPASMLDEKQIRNLHSTLRKICATALRNIGRDWSDPPRSWLFRHRWEKGRACPRCGSTLTRDDVRERTACWCPLCQLAG